MLYVTQRTWQRSSSHSALCMHLLGYLDLGLCHTNTFQSPVQLFLLLKYLQILVVLICYPHKESKSGFSVSVPRCCWHPPAMNSLSTLLIHIPVTWNTGTHPVTAISSNIIQPLDNIMHQESGNRSFFGSTLHSCIWFSFWLSPLAGPIVLLPVI